MYVTLDSFIRENDKEGKIKNAIASCITKNITKEVALDTLANDLQKRLYDFIFVIFVSSDLDIDDGSNIERDFKNAILEILNEYFEDIKPVEGVHTVTLTDEEIDCFNAYIEDAKMNTAFGNSDWREVYRKTVDGRISDYAARKIKWYRQHHELSE